MNVLVNCSLQLSVFDSDGRAESWPRLLHSSNSSQLEVWLDGITTQAPNSRFLLELQAVGGDFPLSRVDVRQFIDDEFTPSIFKVGNVKPQNCQNQNRTRGSSHLPGVRVGVSSSGRLRRVGLRPVEAGGVPPVQPSPGGRHAVPLLWPSESGRERHGGFIRPHSGFLLRTQCHGIERELRPGGRTVLQQHQVPQLVGFPLLNV